MMRVRIAALIVAAAAMSLAGAGARAAEEGPKLPDRSWSFEGLFGTFDQAALQRGFQVYKEVCAACHGMEYIAFRNLHHLGYGEDEIKAIAADWTVTDGPNDEGEMYDRPARPADHIPSPFPNEQAAAAANGGAAPPDLSLLAEARPGGADYLYALMTGYQEPPADVEVTPGSFYNPYFIQGHELAMPPPLSEGVVEYADGTEATVEQMSADVTAFMRWASEPNLETRKQTGLKVILFLLIFTGLLYATKRKIWAKIH